MQRMDNGADAVRRDLHIVNLLQVPSGGERGGVDWKTNATDPGSL